MNRFAEWASNRPRWPLAAACVLSLLGAPAGRAQTAPAITRQPTNQTAPAGSGASFSVGVSGAGPFAYQWLLNGTNLPASVISTVAGGGTHTPSNDGQATNAKLGFVQGVAVDTLGKLISLRVPARSPRKTRGFQRMAANGILFTVVGDGGGGFFGDGGPADNAGIAFPRGIAVDSSGNLFIADTGNHRIRRVDTNAMISTVTGGGTNDPDGGGQATNAALSYPCGVAADSSGNLFIADAGANRIYKVDTNGMIATVAGNGTNSFFGDGAQATNASLNNPAAVAADDFGNLFIADIQNNRVRMVDTNGIITTVAGDGTNGFSGDGASATNAELFSPTGLAVDASGNLFVADSANNRIRMVDTNGIITTVAGNGTNGFSGDGGVATNADLSNPTGVALDASGNLFIADGNNDRIRKVTFLGAAPTLNLNNLTMNDAGSYQVIVTSSVATLAVQWPPVITSQPASQTVGVGSNATFSVTAEGMPPLSYAWYGNGNAIDDATNASYTANQVLPADSGSPFTCVITNVFGSVTSSVGILTVALPPVIVTQPSNQTALAESTALLVPTVSGTGPLSFEWQLNGTNLADYIISTVAGNGTRGFSGDGEQATNAELASPRRYRGGPVRQSVHCG